jgi:hypothetical protein
MARPLRRQEPSLATLRCAPLRAEDQRSLTPPPARPARIRGAPISKISFLPSLLPQPTRKEAAAVSRSRVLL